MKGVLLLLMGALLAMSAGPLPAAQAADKDPFNSVVKLHVLVPEDARSAASLGTEREGSGVVIDGKGHILTIGYLVAEAKSIEVVGPGGDSVEAVFVGYDHETGFGLVKAGKPLGVTPMKLGASAHLKTGDRVLVGGYGGADAAQGAYVINRMEFAASWEYLLEDAIVTIPVLPNFGGAALVGRDGRLLGIGSLETMVSLAGVGSTSCNIFIPIDLLHPILQDLMAGRRRKAPRPWLGINSEETHGRVFISRVTAGGPGEQAGLEKDDLIIAVKGREVRGLADFYRKVWALGEAGVEVPMTLLRGTQFREMKVRSVDRNQFLRLNPGRPI